MNKPRSLSEKIFFDFFPTPSFLEMPSVGLDISDEMVRFVELKKSKTGFELGIFGEQQIPKDVIEEGFVKNKEELRKILSALQVKFDLRYVRVSLPEEKAYLFRTQIPMMDESDIRGAVRFKIEENVPIALADAVFDYHYIKEPKPGDAAIDLGVAVIHNKVVSSYLDVVEGAGLIPLKLRIESQAIAHAIVPENDPGAYIIIAVRETKTILAIVSHGVIQFSSTLSISGASMAASIGKNFSVGSEEANNIRKGKEVKERDEMFQSLVNASSVVRDEVQKLLLYWENHGNLENQTIQKIFLCGSDTLLGFDDYLNRTLQIPVEIANVWTNILSIDKVLPPITYRESLDYASALGLALPYD
jgi:type IV pilus assembly protein PilM